jgi:hypothetical protein
MGTVKTVAANEIIEMNTTFWAQGTTRAVYVLELGDVSVAAAVAALADFIDEDISLGNTYQKFFSYLVPREWDGETTFKTLTACIPARRHWFISSSPPRSPPIRLGRHQKQICVCRRGVAKHPCWRVFHGVPVPVLSGKRSWLIKHGAANGVPFGYGVTEYPVEGNGTLLKQLQDNSINYVGTAAEGGLSNKMLVAGHMLDGNPFNYWYSVAWTAINLELDLANEIINGSNTTVNPLYYEQNGIDRLQRRALKTLRNGISYGLILGRDWYRTDAAGFQYRVRERHVCRERGD